MYPHVRATPNYTENPYFDRAWPQNLYLAPDSPLVDQLNLPTGFNVSSTPLVTFRRVDLLLSQEELVNLYNELHHPAPDFSLFSEERFWSLSPKEYLEIFQKPLPEGNYGTLVISTAGHWTTTLLRGFRDESKGENAGFGIDNMFPFFEKAMTKWADTIQDALTTDRGTAGGRSRQVVVRAYLPGHEDCHSHRQPWTEWQPFKWKWYNWAWISDFNKVFEVCQLLIFWGVSLVEFRSRFIESYLLTILPGYPLSGDRPARTLAPRWGEWFAFQTLRFCS